MAQIDPLVSVIVPAYNVEAYLSKCLTSLVEQSYRALEIIVVDDGSTDGTSEVARQWAERDDRIAVIRQVNGGLSSARNTAMAHSRGQLIAFLDSDDVFLGATLIEDAVRTLMAYPECDIVQFPIRYLYPDGSTKLRFPSEGCPLYGLQALWESFALSTDTLSWTVWNKLYRREFIDAYRFYPRLVYEDAHLATQLLMRARGVCFSPSGAYGYVQRDGSITNSGYRVNHRRDMIFVYGEMLRFVTPYPELQAVRLWLVERLVNDAVDSYRHRGAGVCRRLARAYLPALTGSDSIWRLPLSLRTRLKYLLLRLL